MKKYLLLLPLILMAPATASSFSLFETDLTGRLRGRILLAVEDYGKAWYLNPADNKRYYLGRPADAFEIMKLASIGIADENLEKISIGIVAGEDTDNDGLPDNLENAIGTDLENSDTDGDGYNDRLEISNNFNPAGAGKTNIDENFAGKNAGKIFLRAEKDGQAWYVNPADKKRYYLGRPSDAFAAMKNLSLGIKNKDLEKIIIGSFAPPEQSYPTNPDTGDDGGSDVISSAAAAVRNGDKTIAASYFIPEMKKAIDYTVDFLNAESRLTLAGILSSADLVSSSLDAKKYKSEVYFQGKKINVYLNVKKQADGTWLITNL